MSKQKFQTTRILAKIIKVIAWLGFIAFIIIAISDWGSQSSLEPTNYGFLIWFPVGALWYFFCLLLHDSIQVILDIEENTGKQSLYAQKIYELLDKEN